MKNLNILALMVFAVTLGGCSDSARERAEALTGCKSIVEFNLKTPAGIEEKLSGGGGALTDMVRCMATKNFKYLGGDKYKPDNYSK